MRCEDRRIDESITRALTPSASSSPDRADVG
jgi:hypothetical protein